MDKIALFDYIEQPLTNRRINIFNRDLVEAHIGVTHPIYPIKAKYTLIDALKYIFDHDAVAIADVLQNYEDNIDHALALINALEEGIGSKSICLTCIRNNVTSIINRS